MCLIYKLEHFSQIQMTAALAECHRERTTSFSIQYNYRKVTHSGLYENCVHQLDENMHYLQKSISESDSSQYVPLNVLSEMINIIQAAVPWMDMNNLWQCTGGVWIHKYILERSSIMRLVTQHALTL